MTFRSAEWKITDIQSCPDSSVSRNSTTLEKRLKISATAGIRTQDVRVYSGHEKRSNCGSKMGKITL